jgi:hypothetical protein
VQLKTGNKPLRSLHVSVFQSMVQGNGSIFFNNKVQAGESASKNRCNNKIGPGKTFFQLLLILYLKYDDILMSDRLHFCNL